MGLSAPSTPHRMLKLRKGEKRKKMSNRRSTFITCLERQSDGDYVILQRKTVKNFIVLDVKTLIECKYPHIYYKWWMRRDHGVHEVLQIKSAC